MPRQRFREFSSEYILKRKPKRWERARLATVLMNREVEGVANRITAANELGRRANKLKQKGMVRELGNVLLGAAINDPDRLVKIEAATALAQLIKDKKLKLTPGSLHALQGACKEIGVALPRNKREQ